MNKDPRQGLSERREALESYSVDPDQLTKLPLSMTAGWVSKIVTTDPPKYTPHLEWRLEVRLTATAPFRLGVLTYLPAQVLWGLRPKGPSDHIEASLDFFPYDWSTDDRVQVNFGWQRIAVKDPELKADPRPHTTLLLAEGGATGRVMQVCELPRHSITLAFIAVSKQDAEV